MNKVKIFHTQFLLPTSAKTVWETLTENYGGVANYANGLYSSDYIYHSKKGGEGCERICKIDTKGKKYLIEKMVDVDYENMQFTNLITEVSGLPIVPQLSKTIMSVTSVDNNHCKFTIKSHFRTKPAFLARFMKKVSAKQMHDLTIGLYHYISTGEQVNQNNFKAIKKSYKHLNFLSI